MCWLHNSHSLKLFNLAYFTVSGKSIQEFGNYFSALLSVCELSAFLPNLHLFQKHASLISAIQFTKFKETIQIGQKQMEEIMPW